MRRRRFLGTTFLGVAGAALTAGAGAQVALEMTGTPAKEGDRERLRILLCGDVMTGRGVDQILSHPSAPEIHESYLRSADQYVEVAERVSGPIPRGVDYTYIWGDALPRLAAVAPDLRIINLETAITTSDEYWRDKGIHYRMHPANLPVLTAAGIDCCALANNHVLDWNYRGLEETLKVLHEGGILTAGAGADIDAATAPALLEGRAGRHVLVFAVGVTSSGIGRAWQAGPSRPGIWLVDELSPANLDHIGSIIEAKKRPGDIALVSIHWGGNWGYPVARPTRDFARGLIDRAGVDLVYGHSSHHPLGIEVYRGKLILYGCGDFINDYEGIPGHESYRGELRVMYLPELDGANGSLLAMEMPVFQSRRFRLHNADAEDVAWLAEVLDRESRKLGSARVVANEYDLRLQWS